MAAILVLQLPDPDLLRSRVLAVTRDPDAIRIFRRAVLRHYEERIDSSYTQEARALAQREFDEMCEKLAQVLGGRG